MMKPSYLWALIGAVTGVLILCFGWGVLLVALLAAVGYLAGRQLEGSLDFRAAFNALTGNTKTTSD
ncbi:hypothetical protein BK816_08750 [Boudabousia tangfeifanii]|uniref:DUF2273 domain-containing protein n=1 Tax=Boudabousia tangfeifanii TaxID=1912795 RepID=A0A1D9MM17_9ACTO|nr:hypothetical protein BK816_08750 [Boudabousia tangfeifanii]